MKNAGQALEVQDRRHPSRESVNRGRTMIRITVESAENLPKGGMLGGVSETFCVVQWCRASTGALVHECSCFSC